MIGFKLHVGTLGGFGGKMKSKHQVLRFGVCELKIVEVLY